MRRIPGLRAEIAAIDLQIVDLLAQRAARVGEVWAIKEAEGIPRFDPDQEQRQYARLLEEARARGLEEVASRNWADGFWRRDWAIWFPSWLVDPVNANVADIDGLPGGRVSWPPGPVGPNVNGVDGLGAVSVPW
ncbi:MAG TPA: chorismate mutase [Myxococcota bacterium]|nr:chorismate mutase [Myxococcota bacterium]